MKIKPKLIISILIISVILPVTVLIGARFLFQLYVDSGAKKLVSWEKQGLLSRDYGYVWQEINSNKEMKHLSRLMNTDSTSDTTGNQEALQKKDFPSLAAVDELNRLKSLDKIIRINDRHGIALAQIKNTHTCVDLSELNDTLIEALLVTEDADFFSRKKAYDYNALLRATMLAAYRTLRTLKFHYPRGSSTIHMQVARFLLLKYDSRGYAYVEKTIARKLREIKLAQALKIMYTDEQILTLYANHCVSAGRGMQGFYDISRGLFGVSPDSLTVAQSLYLARLVKWNRHTPTKIIRQVKTNLPILAAHFDWSKNEIETVRSSLDTLSFDKPEPLIARRGYIIDLANEYWREVCRKNGMNDSLLSTMDIANPESIVRRYGNLTIHLTIDYRLQRLLEESVRQRGFGTDTTIRTDIRIGGFGENIQTRTLPPDTVRNTFVYHQDSTYGILPRSALNALDDGDTVICNIRYRRKDKDTVRRSCFFYKRDTLQVPGQYHAYAMMDSRTHKLRAYYSMDQLGSRLRSLHINKAPNGSSVTKPLIYALAYDLGIYSPSDIASDDTEYGDTCAWARSYLYENDSPTGMIYHNVPEDSGYSVQNHNHVFDGYDFLFNHLSHSNNIIAVQTMYHLTTDFQEDKTISKSVKKLLKRVGLKNLNSVNTVTGPQIYGALVDALRGSRNAFDNFAENYSVALGTLELSLFEQMHLFNILYDNSLVTTPENHPSLFIKKITLGGKDISFSDDIDTVRVFDNLENIKPVHLALFKRLTSNAADHLGRYDICTDDGHPTNFAKSGTTDDIIRPFNADITDTARTNYGLWNAVLRLRLKKNDFRRALQTDSLQFAREELQGIFESLPNLEDMDVTLAAFGECNEEFTGPRDGKSLHGYLSRDFLHAFGIPCADEGFYSSYEHQLVSQTSEKDKYASDGKQNNLSFLSRALIKIQTGMGNEAALEEVRFEPARFGWRMRLRGKNYRRMLKFAQFMGEQSKHYSNLIRQLKKPVAREDAEQILSQIDSIQVDNRILKRDLERACSSLRESLEQSDR
ncbi:MAG: transglycosylase domain-containing protein [Chitinispirillaceae bacterium]